MLLDQEKLEQIDLSSSSSSFFFSFFFSLDDSLFCHIFFVQLGTLLFMRLIVICSSVVPHFSQFLFFWPHLWHEVPWLGDESVPQKRPELQQWRCHVLNPLSHQETPIPVFFFFFSSFHNANGWAGMFSFDLRAEQEKDWRLPLGSSGVLDFLFCFFRRTIVLYFSFIRVLSAFAMSWKFSFSLIDTVFHLSEHFLENSEKVTEASGYYLCSSWQVCTKNAYDDTSQSLRISFLMFSYF